MKRQMHLRKILAISVTAALSFSALTGCSMGNGKKNPSDIALDFGTETGSEGNTEGTGDSAQPPEETKDYLNLSEDMKESLSGPTATLPERLKLDLTGGVTMDAYLDVPRELLENKAPSTLTLTYHLLDPDEDIKALWEYCGGQDITAITEGTDMDFYPNGDTAKIVNYEFGQTKWIQVRDGRILAYFGSNPAMEKGIILDQGIDIIYRQALKVPKNLDLEFKPLHEIEEETDQFFRNVGLDFWKSYCLSYTKDFILAEQDFFQPSPLLTEDQLLESEQYVFMYRQGYGGIPYMPYFISPPSYLWVNGTIAYGKDGILDIDIENPMDVAEVGEEQSFLSFYEILNTHMGKLSSLTHANDIVIDQVGLYYLPILKDKGNNIYEAVPVWVFIHNYEHKNAIKTNEISIYNAITGEVLQ